MNKTVKSQPLLLMSSILFVVFTVLAFMLPFYRDISFWTGYAFGALAFTLCTGVLIYAIGRPGIRSKFFGLPLLYIAIPYLTIQIAFSLLQMAIPFLPFRLAFLLNFLVLAAAAIGLIGTNMGTQAVVGLDDRIKANVMVIAQLKGEVESLIACTDNLEIKKSLKSLVETIRYSDPMSKPQLAEQEGQICFMVQLLKTNIQNEPATSSALCKDIENSIAERNRILKTLK